jgi:hypothetical protein
MEVEGREEYRERHKGPLFEENSHVHILFRKQKTQNYGEK